MKKALGSSLQCAGGPGYQNQETALGVTGPRDLDHGEEKKLAVMVGGVFENSSGT